MGRQAEEGADLARAPMFRFPTVRLPGCVPRFHPRLARFHTPECLSSLTSHHHPAGNQRSPIPRKQKPRPREVECGPKSHLGLGNGSVAGFPGFPSPGQRPCPTTPREPGAAGERGRGPSLTLEVDPRADPQHTREGGEVQGANEVVQRHRLHRPRCSLDLDEWQLQALGACSPAPPRRCGRECSAQVGGASSSPGEGLLRVPSDRLDFLNPKMGSSAYLSPWLRDVKGLDQGLTPRGSD